MSHRKSNDNEEDVPWEHKGHEEHVRMMSSFYPDWIFFLFLGHHKDNWSQSQCLFYGPNQANQP